MSLSHKICVVIDTNIIISSAISMDGNPAQIFELLLLEEIINYTTKDIIEEIKEVLERPRIKKRLDAQAKDFIMEQFQAFSHIVIPNVTLKEVKNDPDDDKFLECAITANVDFIISGDEHLLQIKEFRGIKIINPADFIALFHQRT